MLRYAGEVVYTIQEEDIGKQIITIAGRPTLVTSFLGRVLPLDVGKHIIRHKGVLCAETNEQRDTRMKEEET
jgi:hypothetical protein